MKNELRVSVPDDILRRMGGAATPEAAREEGIAIAREMLLAVRSMVQGAQISAPQSRYSSAVDVLEALGEGAQMAYLEESSGGAGYSGSFILIDRSPFHFQIVEQNGWSHDAVGNV